MPIDLTKVFSAVTEVPKDAIGEFAVFTNEIEDFKNIRERPTRIGYLTDVYPLGYENRFVCNRGVGMFLIIRKLRLKKNLQEKLLLLKV